MERVLQNINEFGHVYDDYEMYAHGAGADQINFSGIPEGRTAKILRFIAPKLPKKIKSVLDIGSGSGTGLKALKIQFPKAEIKGYEPTNKDKRPDGKFDLITLFHVLEHVEDLHEMLSYIKSSLISKGHVLIQVPYANIIPFDLVIADHVWHFTFNSLAKLFNEARFKIKYLGNDCIKKEITLLANPCEDGQYQSTRPFNEVDSEDIINWLLNYKSFLDKIDELVAIYGSAPSAAWVGSILGDKVVMYLDDDACRVGATFNGKPIKSPAWLDANLAVVAPFADYAFKEIKEKHPEMRFLES